MRKVVFIILGIILTVFGVVGVLLPVMPGVIFFVLAAYFFSKSSNVMHEALLRLPYVGVSIKDWDHYGVMTLQTKLGLIFFFWVTTFSATLFTSKNFAYPIVILNFAVIFTMSVVAFDNKLK